MSCNIVILGENLDVIEFIKKSGLRRFTKHHRGEPKYRSKLNGEKTTYSSVVSQISNAGFYDLENQIGDAIKYLKKNRSKLSHIKKTKEIDYAMLDFGIASRINKKQPIQTDRYPSELLKLAGELGIDLHISIFAISK